MKILVLGGTRFFGVHTVNQLIKHGHEVSVATRGTNVDCLPDVIKRVHVDRTNDEQMKSCFASAEYDVVFDNIAYCSNDVKRALDHIKCKRYVMMSSISVYEELNLNVLEDELNANLEPLIWCESTDCNYPVGKRRAEAALAQAYPTQNSVAIRFPYVIGKDDYTKRLFWYVDHILNEKPMFINNLNEPISFISSSEAGIFLAWVIEHDYCGTVNASSTETVTLEQLITYIEKVSHKKAILSAEGDQAPYNDASFILNTERASSLGFEFSNINSWIFNLLDEYMNEIIK